MENCEDAAGGDLAARSVVAIETQVEILKEQKKIKHIEKKMKHIKDALGESGDFMEKDYKKALRKKLKLFELRTQCNIDWRSLFWRLKKPLKLMIIHFFALS